MVVENKKNICEEFCRALKSTRAFADLEKLEYEKRDNGLEIVTVRFQNGCIRRINVTADSGIAILKDILQHIDG